MSADHNDMPAPPRLVRFLVLLLAAALTLSALAGLWGAFFAVGAVIWAFAGFELVMLLTAVLAVLAGLARFRQGYGLALLCVAGAVGAGSFLGFLDMRPNFEGAGGSVAELPMPYLIHRAGLAAGFGVAAALAVLSRDRRSWGYLIRGVLAGLPVGLAAAVAMLADLSWFTTPQEGLMEGARIAAILVGGIVLGGFFSVSVHLLIRAFEITRDRTEPNGKPGTTPANGANTAS